MLALEFPDGQLIIIAEVCRVKHEFFRHSSYVERKKKSYMSLLIQAHICWMKTEWMENIFSDYI